MRHRKKGRKLGRKRNQRNALRKSLINNLVLHEKIITTQAKAKEIRPYVEKIITKSKKQDLSARRNLGRYLIKKSAEKVFNDLSQRYSARKGGYLRITKIPSRKNDNAKMCVIEFVK